MSRRAARVLPAVALALLAAGCGASGLPDPPDGYATFRDPATGVEFRHPRSWTVERPAAQPGSVLSVDVRPCGANPDRPGPRIRLRVAELGGEPFEAFAERRERLPGAGSAEGAETTELDPAIPGASRARGKRTEYAEGAERYERVVVAAAGEGALAAALEASAPAADGAVDPAAVAGSLRLGRPRG